MRRRRLSAARAVGIKVPGSTARVSQLSMLEHPHDTQQVADFVGHVRLDALRGRTVPDLRVDLGVSPCCQYD